MIQQVIVVEGKSDIARVRQAVDADLIATGGYALRSAVIQDIRAAYEKRGIIILTDPDGPGEKIRSRLSVMFPEALHAFVPKSEASTEDDVGIENASPESIRKALDKVRILYQESSHEFPALRVRKMPRGKEHLLGLYLASDMGMPSSFCAD